MNFKETYNKTIWDTIELITNYKQLIIDDDLLGLHKTKNLLVANKAILNQIYADACGFVIDLKSELDETRDSKYLEYRKDISQKDAEIKARLDSKELSRSLDEYKLKRNKSGKMLEDTRDVIIEIAVLLREKENQLKYN